MALFILVAVICQILLVHCLSFETDPSSLGWHFAVIPKRSSDSDCDQTRHRCLEEEILWELFERTAEHLKQLQVVSSCFNPNCDETLLPGTAGPAVVSADLLLGRVPEVGPAAKAPAAGPPPAAALP